MVGGRSAYRWHRYVLLSIVLRGRNKTYLTNLFSRLSRSSIVRPGCGLWRGSEGLGCDRRQRSGRDGARYPGGTVYRLRSSGASVPGRINLCRHHCLVCAFVLDSLVCLDPAEASIIFAGTCPQRQSRPPTKGCMQVPRFKL